MAERRSNSPWGSNYKEGLPSTAVNDTIEVNQILRPTVNTGVIDVESGQWEGVVTSDKQFFLSDTATGIANGADVLFPNTANADFIDMTGYNHLIIAIKPSNGGAYETKAVMGPSTRYFANLTPVNAAATLRGNKGFESDFSDILVDSSDTLTTDVWNIFMLSNNLHDQKLVQFQLTNGSGGSSNIDFAYLRVV